MRCAGRRRCGRPAAGSSGSPGWSSRTPTSTTSGWPGRWSGAAAASCGCTRPAGSTWPSTHDPDEAVDRRTLMLADHGLYGRELTESSEGLLDWMPVMPSIGGPGPAAVRRRAARRRRPQLGGRAHPGTLAGARLPVVGGRPGALLGRPPAAGGLPAGHLRARVRARPDGLLPGLAGPGGGAGARAGAARARPAVPGRGPAGRRRSPAASAAGWTRCGTWSRQRAADRHRDHRDPVPRRADRCPAPLRDGRDPRRPCVPRGPRHARAGPPPGRGVPVAPRPVDD